MSTETVQTIPSAGHDHEQTDFPTIAFRSVVPVPPQRLVRIAKPPSTRKAVTEVRSLARSHTRTAINVLARIMRSKDATPAARVAAANALLDRGWGKATQPIGGGDDGVVELIHRIERHIVHSENSDS